MARLLPQALTIMKVTVLFFSIASVPALAMTCSMLPPEKIAKTAVVAFVGTVAKIEESTYKTHALCRGHSPQEPKCGGKLVTVNVTEKIRGRVESKVTVLKEDGCLCLGGDWDVGATYLVVATRNTSRIPGQLVASNVCGGTGELNEGTRKIIKAIRAVNQ